MSMLSLDVTLPQGDFTLTARHDAALGGVTALFGPSGAGKSTLLRVIAGLERGASGQVQFDGTPWQDTGAGQFVPPHRRRVGFVAQQPDLFAHLSVAGNLRYAVKRARGGPITQPMVVEALDLGPLLTRSPAGLSGGERQRVAIGRALLSNPVVLLMDEPLSGLDLRRKAAILPYIADIPREFGVPVIYVTHSVNEVTRLADTMIAMHNGQITDAGPFAETFARLDLESGGSRFEAGVILTGRVTAQDRAYHLTHLDLDGQQLAMPEAPVEVGDAVLLRVRARDVMLATQRPEGLSAQNILSATIREIRPETDRAFAEVFLDVGRQPLRARITRAAVDGLDLSENQPVYAVLKAISFDRRAL